MAVVHKTLPTCLNPLMIGITVPTADRARQAQPVAAINAVTPDFIAPDTDALRKAPLNAAGTFVIRE